MEIAKNLITEIENKLRVIVNGAFAVDGGSINKVYRLDTSGGNLLLKVNNGHSFPKTFKLEREGLAAIKATQTIAVPDVLLNGEVGADSYLLMRWIAPGRASQKALYLLGEQLAQMHGHTATHFGFATDNYMGSLPQSNKMHSTWSSFFIEERLKPMVAIAIQKQELNNNDIALFEKLYMLLPELFPEESPALIHGDLWSGNYLIDSGEKPYLIDPAVSYSNREFDIAMTTLFGGFGNEFYDAYNSCFPLQKGWQQRLNLWNLYPLLLHVNLFGSSYLTDTRRCLAAFVKIN